MGAYDVPEVLSSEEVGDASACAAMCAADTISVATSRMPDELVVLVLAVLMTLAPAPDVGDPSGAGTTTGLSI